jgi:hypothetical protein
MKNKLFLIISVISLSLLIVLPAFAGGISGPGISGINIQNLDSSSASVVVQLYNQTGAGAVTISGASGDTIPGSSAKNYYLPNFSTVPDGAYAMVVSSDKRVAALARTDWNNTGGAGIYVSVEPGTDITIPMALANFAGQVSQFSIQNTNTNSTINDVKITLNGRGLTNPVKELLNQTIAAGTSKTYNLADTGVWGTLPDTALDLNTTGFVGSLRITSSTPLVVQSFIDITNSPRTVTAFSGIPTSNAAQSVFCPLVRANFYGDTGISIVNPNTYDINVDITFYADGVSPKQGSFTQTIAVKAKSSNIAFQGPGGNSRQAPTNLPGGTQNTSNPNYTNDGFFGVAKLSSTSGTFLAVVNDTVFATNWIPTSGTTYNCLTTTNSGTKFALPLVRKNHVSNLKLTTGTAIQNVTGNPITVSMDIYNYDGTALPAAKPADITIPAYGSGNFYQGNLVNVPTVPANQGGFGWYGSAVVTVQTPGGAVVVLVNDAGNGTKKVDAANYEGLLMP